MNYDKEIERGRKVRLYLDKGAADHMAEFNSLPQHNWRLTHVQNHHSDKPVLLILPPESLEIEGYVCDYEPDFGSADPFCFSQEGCNHNEEEANCRSITLIEKGAGHCEK